MATRMLARMQASMLVRATATTIFVMTGPTCWVMISSIGAARCGLDGVRILDREHVDDVHQPNSMTIEAVNA